MKDIVDTYIAQLQMVVAQLSQNEILEGFQFIEETYNREGTVYIIGNGGSASTASHMACDFGKGASCQGRRRLRVMSLTDNVAHMSAISNDISYDAVFVEQLRNLLGKGDLLIGISASGNSPNLLKAFDYAGELNLPTLALVGFDGGKMGQIASCSIHVNTKSYGIAEDVHLIVNHIWTEMLKELVARNSEG